MSNINTEIKPFKATAFHAGKFVPVSDTDLKGKWSIVFFYPADFTFVCPTELGDMADVYPEFQKLGVEVYSVSTDTHFTHKAWHDTSDTIKKINYPMIGDPTGVITRNFGVMIEEEGLALRGTFVINPEGVTSSPPTCWSMTAAKCACSTSASASSPTARTSAHRRCGERSPPAMPRPNSCWAPRRAPPSMSTGWARCCTGC